MFPIYTNGAIYLHWHLRNAIGSVENIQKRPKTTLFGKLENWTHTMFFNLTRHWDALSAVYILFHKFHCTGASYNDHGQYADFLLSSAMFWGKYVGSQTSNIFGLLQICLHDNKFSSTVMKLATLWRKRLHETSVSQRLKKWLFEYKIY